MRKTVTEPESKISVVVPHLNQAQQLERCLASLMAQTFDMSRVEIIVVDNGSSELPEQTCGRFAGVRLIREDKPGPGPARNQGVSVSRARILTFIDADCTADKNWLKAIVERFSDHEDEQILGGDVRIGLRDAHQMTTLEAYESVYAYRQQEYIEKKGFSGTGNLAMRRGVYDDVGPFGGIEIAEDRDWGRRAVLLGYTIKYVPDMIVYHPARDSFDDIFKKWDRHIRHDFEEMSVGLSGRAKWALYAVAVALSPIAEIGKIFASRRISGMSARSRALFAVIAIRLYRAFRMFSLLLSRNVASYSEKWNR